MANWNRLSKKEQVWIESRKEARRVRHNPEYEHLQPLAALVSAYVTTGGNRLEAKIKLK